MGMEGETELTGKHDDELINMCTGCNMDRSKVVKSGKYVKTNIDIKVQEQWLHMNVMKKYSKRVMFDMLEFDAFVAGETRTISQMEDKNAAYGRLQVLCKMAHWLCRSKDWPLIRGLYEAVIESIEMGEEQWTSDFGHYEMMVPCAGRQEIKERDKGEKRKEKTEVFWCKQFQRGNCSERSPHMMQLKMDEPPMPVLHCCAYCLQKENKRVEHAEQDCPAKKGS